MRLIGNLLWFLLGGFLLGICWALAGLFWCVTIVGIPWGIQCFKFAKLAFFPFGKEIVPGTGAGSFLLNLLWLLLSGAELAILAAVSGAVLCVTVVGIPGGLQCFKFAQLALFPFGAQVRRA
ncbi:MAG: YccF domain-containing protein [Clostridiaceae bacterium]|nr:YccF domain-containing protein [Eubacteriales bacterium]